MHSADGLLIEHVKEHRLDCDLRPRDKLFFQAPCGSAAWHWQLSALASGCSIVLHDGPMDDAGTLRRIVHDERASPFGTNPPGLKPGEGPALAPVRGAHGRPAPRGILQREGAALE